jgi:hypothetical protein
MNIADRFTCYSFRTEMLEYKINCHNPTVDETNSKRYQDKANNSEKCLEMENKRRKKYLELVFLNVLFGRVYLTLSGHAGTNLYVLKFKL